MKSSNKVKQNTLSMKDALSDFQNLNVVKKEVKNSLRDVIWNYPISFAKFFKKTIPLSYIFFSLLFALGLSWFLQSKSFANMLENVSAADDTYTEGMVGAISSFNPLFISANYVDKAIDSLIFDKFVYIGTDGKPVAGVAKSWAVSSNGLEYTFVIDNSFYWQDGTPLTMEDVLFTFNTAISLYEDYNDDSSVGVALVGITISKIDDQTIKFALPEANPTFFEAISIYIVPKSELEDVSLANMQSEDDFRLSPMGSGKYQIEKTEQNAVYLTDNPYDVYDPYLKNLVLRIYPSYDSLQTALRVGTIDACGSLDNEALAFMQEYSSYGVLTKTEKYRNRMLFFNIRKDVLSDENLRIGLSYLLDKAKMLGEANISGKVMNGPYSEDSWAYNDSVDYYAYNVDSATKYLKKAGYTKNAETGYFESEEGDILSFTLSYFDNEINNRLVNSIVGLFNDEGVVLTPVKFTYDEIIQQVIATRDFELLLYEVETTVDPDQYNLWHSIKVDFPDLNLSGYNYERVDVLLEEARKTTNQATRKSKYLLFQKYLMADAPVIFLYHPTYTFYFDSELKGIDLNNIDFSYERYWNIENWYWNN